MECKICGKECKNYNSLAQHIRKHKISSKEYYDKYLTTSSVHLCKFCGETVSKFLNINRGYATTCGIECSRRNVFKHINVEARNKKSIQTKLRRYGSATYNNTSKRKITVSNFTEEKKLSIKNKRRSTCQEKFGVNAPMQSPEIRRKWISNYFEKTGYHHQRENPEVNKKIRETTLERYGVDNCRKSPAVKEKIRDTKLKMYGNQNNIEKTRLTNIKRYGAPCSWANPEVRAKCFQRYVYENINFDSSLELAFYIYNKDRGESIVRNSNIFFEYVVNGKEHRCFPDFKIGDNLYEIKGDQFLDPVSGKWKDPFSSNNDIFYEAKHQCLLQNSVNIIYQKDMAHCLSYVEEVYGKSYLKQFKKK